MPKTFYTSLFDFLDTHRINFVLDANIVRFKDYDYSLFLVLKQSNNTYDNFIQNRDFEQIEHNKYLIFIWYDLWTTKQDIILSKLTHLFGLSKKIHARKTKIELISKLDCNLFFNQNHLNQPVIGYKRVGLILNNELIALGSFAKKRKFRDDTYSAELLQFSTKNYHHVNGGLSKIIKHFAKIHPIDSLMTYIDLDWSKGEKFNKIGFNYISEKSQVYFKLNNSTHKRSVNIDSSPIFNTGSLKSVLKTKIYL